ncbi:hypothetical protein CXF63_00410 [Psychrobacter sp. Choline-3u-12]|nr:hypothetical protein CXF63_00410 [Psychrobacter sp. Choline-3u-12]
MYNLHSVSFYRNYIELTIQLSDTIFYSRLYTRIKRTRIKKQPLFNDCFLSITTICLLRYERIFS